jgi:hypothetical protein
MKGGARSVRELALMVEERNQSMENPYPREVAVVVENHSYLASDVEDTPASVPSAVETQCYKDKVYPFPKVVLIGVAHPKLEKMALVYS